MDTDLLKRYVRLQEAIEIADKRLKQLKAHSATLEQVVLDELSQGDGDEKETFRITVPGRTSKRTLFIRTDRFASVKDGDTERALEVLDELELETMHKDAPTLQSVSAWMREELDREDGKLPARFLEAFNVVEKHRVGARKAS